MFVYGGAHAPSPRRVHAERAGVDPAAGRAARQIHIAIQLTITHDNSNKSQRVQLTISAR